MNHLYQYAKQESLYAGNLHSFMDLVDDAHVSVLHHIIRTKSVDDYKSSLKYAKFAWIEGTDIDYTVISDFLPRAQEYSTKFQEVMVILDVHTEAENIPPMHAKN